MDDPWWHGIAAYLEARGVRLFKRTYIRDHELEGNSYKSPNDNHQFWHITRLRKSTEKLDIKFHDHFSPALLCFVVCTTGKAITGEIDCNSVKRSNIRTVRTGERDTFGKLSILPRTRRCFLTSGAWALLTEHFSAIHASRSQERWRGREPPST